jgi:hypothetical protein
MTDQRCGRCDTCVSRRHAQLVQSPAGTWTVVDLESANGTYIAVGGAAPTDDIDAIPVGIPTPVGDRDVIYVGAWSKLTVRYGGA